MEAWAQRSPGRSRAPKGGRVKRLRNALPSSLSAAAKSRGWDDDDWLWRERQEEGEGGGNERMPLVRAAMAVVPGATRRGHRLRELANAAGESSDGSSSRSDKKRAKVDGTSECQWQ